MKIKVEICCDFCNAKVYDAHMHIYEALSILKPPMIYFINEKINKEIKIRNYICDNCKTNEID